MIDGADAEWMAQTHGLMDYGRRPYGFPVSRDWEDIDCKAVGCKYNRSEKCMVPSLCKIGMKGECTGFVPKPMEISKPDGD